MAVLTELQAEDVVEEAKDVVEGRDRKREAAESGSLVYLCSSKPRVGLRSFGMPTFA